MPNQRNGTWEHWWGIMWNVNAPYDLDLWGNEDEAWAEYKRTKNPAQFCEVYVFVPKAVSESQQPTP